MTVYNSPYVQKMGAHYHFIGIGGIGMSALAHILLDKKLSVSGSDLTLNQRIDKLALRGAVIQKGHAAKHISSSATVVISSSIGKTNPEYRAAVALKCPILHRSELLAELMQGRSTLAVTGTHGKTTTSSLLAAVLGHGGLDPSFAVGGVSDGLNGKWGKGHYFVAEADESDGTFLHYHPEGAILTNIEGEHLDYFGTEEKLRQAFQAFIGQVRNPELLFYCGDDPVLEKLVGNKGTSYGFSKACQLRITAFRQEKWHILFDLTFEGKTYKGVEAQLIGEHNALNSAAVFGLALRLRVLEATIRQAFHSFAGISRHTEKKGEVKSVLFLDDYAHHPTEIECNLKAVKRAVGERRLVAIFQPHRYSRTRDQLKAFGGAFEWADLLYVTDIYAAGEKPLPGISATELIKTIRAHFTVPCHYLPNGQWVERLASMIRPHDVVFTMGAGDITYFSERLIPSISPKLVVGLIFGGVSCEHEISLQSSRFVSESLNQNLYELCYFAVDKEGRWTTGEEAEFILKKRKAVDPKKGGSFLDPVIASALERCDLFLPIAHGPFGEDGSLQGFLEVLNKPYIGPTILAAALSIDKVLAKQLVSLQGVQTPEYLTFRYPEWLEDRVSFLQAIESTLPFPLYVKPVHLGSSVGVSRVENSQDLEKAIQLAFRYDSQVMVEEGKVDCRELEFAIMGNVGHPIACPPPGEKLGGGEFVDYEKKYGAYPVATSVYPDLDPATLQRGRAFAQAVYVALGCTGMARVDFLLDREGTFWFFEINTIPGLQKRSLFPKIWEREGMAKESLFDRLIILALDRSSQKKRHFVPLRL